MINICDAGEDSFSGYALLKAFIFSERVERCQSNI